MSSANEMRKLMESVYSPLREDDGFSIVVPIKIDLNAIVDWFEDDVGVMKAAQSKDFKDFIQNMVNTDEQLENDIHEWFADLIGSGSDGGERDRGERADDDFDLGIGDDDDFGDADNTY